MDHQITSNINSDSVNLYNKHNNICHLLIFIAPMVQSRSISLHQNHPNTYQQLKLFIHSNVLLFFICMIRNHYHLCRQMDLSLSQFLKMIRIVESVPVMHIFIKVYIIVSCIYQNLNLQNSLLFKMLYTQRSIYRINDHYQQLNLQGSFLFLTIAFVDYFLV